MAPCAFLECRLKRAAVRPGSRRRGASALPLLEQRVVARWLSLHRMTPPRAGPCSPERPRLRAGSALTRSITRREGCRGRALAMPIRRVPRPRGRATSPCNQLHGGLAHRRRGTPEHRSSASGPEDPRAYCLRALEEILGGGQRASAPSKVLRGPSTPGRELFGGHAEIKDAGRASPDSSLLASSASSVRLLDFGVGDQVVEEIGAADGLDVLLPLRAFCAVDCTVKPSPPRR